MSAAAVAPRRRAGRRPARATVAAISGWAAPALAAALAAAMRLPGLGAVRVDPFYDAAVRSMGGSWQGDAKLLYLKPDGTTSMQSAPGAVPVMQLTLNDTNFQQLSQRFTTPPKTGSIEMTSKAPLRRGFLFQAEYPPKLDFAAQNPEALAFPEMNRTTNR